MQTMDGLEIRWFQLVSQQKLNEIQALSNKLLLTKLLILSSAFHSRLEETSLHIIN